jgi:uncharacterized DUF497 family protein
VPRHPRHAEDVHFDEGNESELAAHGITASEAVELLNNDPVWAPNKKGRTALWLAVGYTDAGRALTVPATYDESRAMVRPVTGWDSTDGEKAKYLKGR